MAEEATTPIAADAPKTADGPTRPIDAAESAAVAEEKPSDGGDIAGDAPVEGSSCRIEPLLDYRSLRLEQAPATAAATDEQVAKDDAADAKPDTAVAEASGDAAATEELATTNGTPASGKKANNNRRKSTGGIPEHKSKKTPSKKGKKEVRLNLNTKPGDMWMVAMRGFQPWPVIIADEDMLPETLLAKRPVSAMRMDGTYREDFLEGGKNAKERRYPVMFLSTNEFAWQPNTELLPFDIEAIKKDVEAGNNAKKSKALWDAYVIAAEGHDLQYFKDLLINHEKALADDELVQETKREEKAEKVKKAAKRKSTAGVEGEDVEMEDADDTAAPSAKKAKPSKKRKKEAGSEGDEEKPAKTPKTKLTLKQKKPATEPKKSKAAKAGSEPAMPEEPSLPEESPLAKRKKTVLYLRHRLQKGFLTRDKPPREEEMSLMSGFIDQLAGEDLDNLEPDIIRETKVHKVLKGILKLERIPRDEEFNIRQRSQELLTKWNAVLSAGEDAAEKPSAPATNGVKPEEKSTDEHSPVPVVEKKDEALAGTQEAKAKDMDGDVAMAESTKETEEPKEEAPATETNGDAQAEKVADTVEAAA
ncbi:hypothetical protein BU23DRAFT_67437 [Bimuria novae-zelandiae CBS 107.79]|uniref:PWWP domain-containing protein n=1 Tax=Bimuria novae-zelandiae CBS 107.79 TaxID=1447943 RepID=A0A6A5VIX6_9PLEO|nr:hypothetical protein BU23DRAFT_67437 [Bimuria novae-zelandiae CBS 107.79]